jgi:hypothetical protein
LAAVNVADDLGPMGEAAAVSLILIAIDYKMYIELNMLVTGSIHARLDAVPDSTLNNIRFLPHLSLLFPRNPRLPAHILLSTLLLATTEYMHALPASARRVRLLSLGYCER